MKDKFVDFKNIINDNKTKIPLGFQFLEIIDFNEEEKKTNRINKTLINNSTPFYIQVISPNKPLIRIL